MSDFRKKIFCLFLNSVLFIYVSYSNKLYMLKLNNFVFKNMLEKSPALIPLYKQCICSAYVLLLSVQNVVIIIRMLLRQIVCTCPYSHLY